MGIGKKLIIQDDLIGESTIKYEMSDKLSREELIATLDFCKKMYTSRLHALEPSNSHERLQAQFDERIYQIKARLQPVSEGKLDEFVAENYARIMEETVGDCPTFGEDDFEDILKAYDKIKESADEK